MRRSASLFSSIENLPFVEQVYTEAMNIMPAYYGILAFLSRQIQIIMQLNMTFSFIFNVFVSYHKKNIKQYAIDSGF